MPNWCNNYLTIEGNDETLREIHKFVKSEKTAFDFEKIIPMPDYIYRGTIGTKEMEIYGENNWYDWSIENWGTKWNSEDVEIDGDDIRFLTAWSPCVPVVAALAEMFPTMRFVHAFYEEGIGFCGQRVYENGKIIFSFDGDYCENPFWEEDDDEAKEYILFDSMFPVEEFGLRTVITDKEEYGNCITGKLYFRDYGNNKIHMMADGNFVARRDYVFQNGTMVESDLLLAS